MQQKTRILIADDNIDMVETLVDILTFLGHEVVHVRNGMEAVERVEQQAFDLVLLDLHMPQLDGMAAFRRIQACRPELPVMLMTGWSVGSEWERAEQEGVTKVLSKPFDPRTLVEAVQQLSTSESSQARVLIVDDDAAICDVLSRALKRKGHQAESVATAEEAIQRITEVPYDIAFIDICLPDINGMEAYRRLRHIRPQTVAIMMTGYGNHPEVRRMLREAEQDGFVCLEKPFTIERMLSLVCQVHTD